MKRRLKPWPMGKVRTGHEGWFRDIERSVPKSRAGIERRIDDMLDLCSLLGERTRFRMRVLGHADAMAVRLLELRGMKSL